MSEFATDQFNCSSDEECIDSNVYEDMNAHVNVSMCCDSNSLCTYKGCTYLSMSRQLRDVDKSKLVNSHNSKERQDKIVARKSYCRKI